MKFSLPRFETHHKDLVLPWILRIGVAGCFIGHGAFGVSTKAGWLPYFAVAGIPEDLAWKLMPMVGTMDILMGLSVLIFPTRAVLLWATMWTVWTALLRPLSGEPIWETLERAGNYGVPFAILLTVGVHGPLLQRVPTRWPTLDASTRQRLSWALRVTTASLLMGHAGLGLFSRKHGLSLHYEAVGLSGSITPLVGAFEFFLAAAVLLRPSPRLLLSIVLWKVSTELLFIPAGAPFWEVIERFGSYTAPLALATMMRRDFPRWAERALRPA